MDLNYFNKIKQKSILNQIDSISQKLNEPETDLFSGNALNSNMLDTLLLLLEVNILA